MAYKFQLGHAIMSGALDQDGDILVKNEAGFPQVVLEQDGDVSGSGDFSAGGTVSVLGVAQTAVDIATDSLYFFDVSSGLMKHEGIAAFCTDVAGDGLQQTGNQLAIDASDFAGSGLEDDGSDNLRIAAAAAGDGLAGGAGSALSVAVSGAIHVSGDKVSMSGSVAGKGLSYLGGVDSILSLGLEFQELTAKGANLITGDLMTIVDSANSNESRKVTMTNLGGFLAGTGITNTGGVLSVDVAGGDTISVTAKANGAALAPGINYHAAVQTGSVNYTLPAVAVGDNGNIITIKGNSGTTEVRYILITPDTGDSIDSVVNQTIKLESPHAAVQLVYIHADTSWRLV